MPVVCTDDDDPTPLKLTLTTRSPASAAVRAAVTRLDSDAAPVLLSVTRSMRWPRFQPAPAMPTALLPLPAAQPVVRVPWPLMSATAPPALSHRIEGTLNPSRRLRRRSPCVVRTPVSQSAITTDGEPVSRSHAAHEPSRFAAWCH